jgi:hypothetical protein
MRSDPVKQQSFRGLSVAFSALVGTWAALAILLGNLLPLPSREDDRVVVEGAQIWRSTFPIRVVRTNPCTDDVVVFDLTLALDIKARVEGEDAQVIVLAALSSTPSASAPDGIVPVREHFGFFAPLYGQVSHVHDVRAPITGQKVPAELVVGVQQGVDGAGQLSITPGQIRVVCT